MAHALPFKLVAPSTLGGRRLTQVELVGRNGGPGALATYGRGLDGIAVLQRKAEPAKAAPAQRGERHGRTLSLPRVNVGGVSAEELVTPLGTVIRFERGGVSYVVVGSVPKSTAEAAARGLVR